MHSVRSERVRVILVWLSGGNLYAVSYHSGRGYVRVYERDRYDARVMPDLPFFDTAEEAFQYMREHEGYDGICQVEVGRATRDLGYDDRELEGEIARLGCRQMKTA